MVILKSMQAAFYQSEFDQPHPSRARAIIKAHPEVRQLMVRNPYTALIAASLVIMQTAIAYGMGTLGFGYWWLSLLIAYCVGAFANHANYVIIHDATHNLILRSKSWNKMVSQGDLAHALSVFPTDPAAPVEGHQDVGPVVLREFCLCSGVRCRNYLFLRLAGISLSRIRVFLFDWTASGGCSLDSGALHLRFRPGDIQLLRPDQSRGAKHGLSQRAP